MLNDVAGEINMELNVSDRQWLLLLSIELKNILVLTASFSCFNYCEGYYETEVTYLEERLSLSNTGEKYTRLIL